MKFFKSLFVLTAFFVSAFVLTSLTCRECIAPTITLDPTLTEVTLEHGEKFVVNVTLKGEKENIKSVFVARSVNSATGNPNFVAIDNIFAKDKSFVLSDSISPSIGFGSVIVYTITATSDCTDESHSEQTYTVKVGASTKRITDSVYNTTSPNMYGPWAPAGFNKAWHFVPAPQPGARDDSDPDAEKDIHDSSAQLTAASPFIPVAKWNSRNGSRFLKVNSFDYGNASQKSIYDAWKNGAANSTSSVTLADNDIIIVNMKNENRFALVKIREVKEDGTTKGTVMFMYKLAQ